MSIFSKVKGITGNWNVFWTLYSDVDRFFEKLFHHITYYRNTEHILRMSKILYHRVKSDYESSR